jgi:hypothetical protein
MQIETIGKYQLHLIAHEVAGGKSWDPFVTILEFDDQTQDFRCVVEKRRASDEPLADYEDAIKVASRFGNALIEAGKV